MVFVFEYYGVEGGKIQTKSTVTVSTAHREPEERTSVSVCLFLRGNGVFQVRSDTKRIKISH